MKYNTLSKFDFFRISLDDPDLLEAKIDSYRHKSFKSDLASFQFMEGSLSLMWPEVYSRIANDDLTTNQRRVNLFDEAIAVAANQKQRIVLNLGDLSGHKYSFGRNLSNIRGCITATNAGQATFFENLDKSNIQMYLKGKSFHKIAPGLQNSNLYLDIDGIRGSLATTVAKDAVDSNVTVVGLRDFVGYIAKSAIRCSVNLAMNRHEEEGSRMYYSAIALGHGASNCAFYSEDIPEYFLAPSSSFVTDGKTIRNGCFKNGATNPNAIRLLEPTSHSEII